MNFSFHSRGDAIRLGILFQAIVYVVWLCRLSKCRDDEEEAKSTCTARECSKRCDCARYIVTLKLPFKENSKQAIDLTWCRSSCSCPSSYTKCHRHMNIIERIQHHHMRMPSLVTSQYKFRSMVAHCFSSCFLHAPPLRLHCSADRLCAFFSSSTSTTSKKRNFYIFPSLSSFLFMQRDGTIN